MPARLDARLQAARRIDWRFLLPRPALKRVAYFGPRRPALLEALHKFSAELTLTQAAEAPVVPARFDLIVMPDATPAGLAWAASQLEPGGCLYLEAYGLFGPGWPASLAGRRLRSIGQHVALLRRCGLVEIQAYWHWPDFEACTEMIPLDDQAALRYALARRGSTPMARLRAWLGGRLLRAGLLTHFVPCYSIVARQPGSG